MGVFKEVYEYPYFNYFIELSPGYWKENFKRRNELVAKWIRLNWKHVEEVMCRIFHKMSSWNVFGTYFFCVIPKVTKQVLI